MFTVVQLKKHVGAKPSMSIVPNGWIINETLFWPQKNQITLVKDPHSKADPATWKMIGKIMDKSATLSNTEKLVDVKDLEDAHILSRATHNINAAKKQTFASTENAVS